MNYKGLKDKKLHCLNCKELFQHSYSSTNKYCSLACYNEHKMKKKDAEFKRLWQAGKLIDNSGNRKRIYGWLKEQHGDMCSVCNCTGTHNGKPLRFWVDHKDGDSSNNRPDNFRLICPNCESQSETFAGRNRGKGRKKHTGSYFS